MKYIGSREGGKGNTLYEFAMNEDQIDIIRHEIRKLYQITPKTFILTRYRNQLRNIVETLDDVWVKQIKIHK